MYRSNFMVSVFGLLRNSSLIFTLAVVIGLGYPGPTHYIEPLITPALLMMMLFSMVEIDLSFRGDPKGALMGFGLNYILLSGFILALSFTLKDESCGRGLL